VTLQANWKSFGVENWPSGTAGAHGDHSGVEWLIVPTLPVTVAEEAATSGTGRIRRLHLVYLVWFQSRLLVFIQWGLRYLTFSRGARLITRSADSGSLRQN